MQAPRPVRVFQVATGNVGRERARRIAGHPDLELVGLHRDTPDRVDFKGVFPDMDLFETVLRAGINVVSTADGITGHHRDAHHPHPSGKPATQVIREACAYGASSFYGTGMSPGPAQIVAMVSSAGMALRAFAGRMPLAPRRP